MFIDAHLLYNLCTCCFKSRKSYRTSILIQTMSKGSQTDRIAAQRGSGLSLEKSIQIDTLSGKQVSIEESHGEYIVLTKTALTPHL